MLERDSAYGERTIKNKHRERGKGGGEITDLLFQPKDDNKQFSLCEMFRESDKCSGKRHPLKILGLYKRARDDEESRLGGLGLKKSRKI